MLVVVVVGVPVVVVVGEPVSTPTPVPIVVLKDDEPVGVPVVDKDDIFEFKMFVTPETTVDNAVVLKVVVFQAKTSAGKARTFIVLASDIDEINILPTASVYMPSLILVFIIFFPIKQTHWKINIIH